MNKRLFFITVFCVALIASNSIPGDEPVGSVIEGLNDLTHYPRIEHFEQGSVQVDFPTVDDWQDFRWMNVWLPVEIRLVDENTAYVGSVLVRADTDVDPAKRTVRFSNLLVQSLKLSQGDAPEIVSTLVNKAFEGRESIVPLDIILRLLPDSFEVPGQSIAVSGLNFEPPNIIVSDKPLKLLAIDRKPVRYPVEGTEIEWVVNTNWHVFFYRPESRWFVLNGETWQSNNYLSSGDWVNVESLPADFQKLVQEEYWSSLRPLIPPVKPDKPPEAFFISLEATELVLIEGPPVLAEIEGTDIHYVTNTQSDLLKLEGHWYYLVSGRWFKNDSLQGRWEPVGELPKEFGEIPADHAMGHVLFSVPGTRQSSLARIEASIPHRVTIARDALAELEVDWAGEPRFERIDRTSLERGLNTPFQVIKHNNYFYLCYEGAWYFSDSPTGDWKVALEIPDEIYRIPASDPAFNVTFVRLESAQEPASQRVTYRSSGGYRGNYATRFSVVYGTGWNHPAQVYWDSTQGPAYWRHGWTYGYGMGYYPVGSYYRPRYPYYNGWYGWGAYRPTTTMRIESAPVEYRHGSSPGRQWSRTGSSGSGPANSSLEQFLPKKRVDGTETFTPVTAEESKAAAGVSAASLYATTSLSSTRFSGRDGQVYKKKGADWQQYSDGDWRSMKDLHNGGPAPRPVEKAASGQREPWLPARKRELSRSELDEQELSRLEGMDHYARYRMEKDFDK